MKVVAFLQLYNEHQAGNLVRCLENCRRWADDIFIYDDCSNDGSMDVYREYTRRENIIVGERREFASELFHKNQLLGLALDSTPDWIGWIDGDTVLCRRWTQNCKSLLETCGSFGMDGVYLHNLNLWRHPAYYRIDLAFDGLWHLVFWRNNGRLRYQPTRGLHQQQFPHGIACPGRAPYEDPLIHYGFASEQAIVRKFLTYKSHGQRGHDLERLVDEQTSLVLNKVPLDWYPEENVPGDYDAAPAPTPLTYNEYRPFDSYEQYLASKEGLP